MPLPMNQVESPTQPKPSSAVPLTKFPQVTAHASGRIVYQLIAATTALGVARVIKHNAKGLGTGHLSHTPSYSSYPHGQDISFFFSVALLFPPH